MLNFLQENVKNLIHSNCAIAGKTVRLSYMRLSHRQVWTGGKKRQLTGAGYLAYDHLKKISEIVLGQVEVPCLYRTPTDTTAAITCASLGRTKEVG